MPNISSEQLQAEIINQVRTYTSQVKEEIDELAKQSVKEFIADVKKQEAFKNRTGDYKKGWRLKKVEKGYVAHNKTDYQLTHLLEKGHAKRGGGRVEAKIHIDPAENRAVTSFLQEVKRVIRT